MNIKVRLEVRNGGLVGEFIIPPFLRWPEIMVWGERHFILHKTDVDKKPCCERDTNGDGDCDKHPEVVVYREACAFWLVEGASAVKV